MEILKKKMGLFASKPQRENETPLTEEEIQNRLFDYVFAAGCALAVLVFAVIFFRLTEWALLGVEGVVLAARAVGAALMGN